jgi:magnesium-protoporphyrin IX monomethyl ester (oxidative) cyclase
MVMEKNMESAESLLKGQIPSAGTINESTKAALEDAVLSPRFYTTNFAEIDQVKIDLLRREWDVLMAEFAADKNADHFQRPADMDKDYSKINPELYDEFVDFLISSITSEFSGCILYAEIKRKVKNQDMKDLFGYMARDESRHAGFINQWLKDFNIGIDLGFLAKSKKYTYFKPKFIYYATYLSEKIGYARYITIFRELEKTPELRFHPIFLWFERWCNDEFRHGEAFALIMRANPKLLSGINKYWIRFFTLAVYATMYVRDHSRPQLYRAMNISPTDYDKKVLRITNEITKQVFPVMLNLDDPRFYIYLEQMLALFQKMDVYKKNGGLLAKLMVPLLGVRVGLVFVKTYFLPVISNELPADVRMAPSW